MRWEISGGTAAVLWVAASRIWSELHASCLYDSYLAFSSNVSSESRWCSHAIVLKRLQFRINNVLFY